MGRKLTYEFVRCYVLDTGETLVSKRYKNSTSSKLEFQCPQRHRYNMTWHHFQQGQGCPSCAEHGFNPSKPATLYYLEVLYRKKYFYKIGITNNSVQERYPCKSDRKKIVVLAEWMYRKGQDARDEEQSIIENFQDYLYKGRAIILEGAAGNAELFTENVLNI